MNWLVVLNHICVFITTFAYDFGVLHDPSIRLQLWWLIRVMCLISYQSGFSTETEPIGDFVCVCVYPYGVCICVHISRELFQGIDLIWLCRLTSPKSSVQTRMGAEWIPSGRSWCFCLEAEFLLQGNSVGF